MASSLKWIFVSCSAKERYAKPYAEIPGPRELPIIGNSWRFAPIIGDYSIVFVKLSPDESLIGLIYVIEIKTLASAGARKDAARKHVSLLLRATQSRELHDTKRRRQDSS